MAASHDPPAEEDDDLRPEYDLSQLKGGVRGKYYERYLARRERLDREGRTVVNADRLEVGNRIRITAVPGTGVPGYIIHRDTVRVYKRLIARGRAVRICEIDEYGQPWFVCRLLRKSGTWEEHFLAVFADDKNWVRVKPRREGE